MTKPPTPTPGLHRRAPWPWAKNDTAAHAARAPGRVPEALVPVQAHASRDQLRRLLPRAWADDSHSIEGQDGGLCIRGPQAKAIAAQLCHAVDLLGLLGIRGHLATDILMEHPEGVTPWQAVSIRESPDWGRIQGDPASCLALLEQLQARRLPLACHLFVRLTPALQLSVLQAVPAFDQRFGQRLAAELASTNELLQARPPTALWCQLELQRLDCMVLQESMDSAFRDLGQRLMAQGDGPSLARLLSACPHGTLRALLVSLDAWDALAACCTAEPGLAAALGEARARLAPAEPLPRPAR